MKFWIGILLVCSGLSASAQECAVTIPLGAFVKDTQRVPALRPSDLSFTTGGSPLPVRRIDTLPVRRFVIVVDASSSMRGESKNSGHKYQFAQAIALSLLKQAPGDSAIGLVTFGAGPIVRVAPAQNREALEQALKNIDSVTKTGQTPLWDALSDAHSLMQPSTAGDFIVVVTDGGSNQGKLNRTDVTSMLISKGTRAFSVLLTEPSPRTIEEYHAPEEVDEFTKQTGGIQLTIEMPSRGGLSYETPADIVAKRTLDLASHYYLVSVGANAEQIGKKLSVKLLESIPKVTLAYPRKIMACK